MSTFAFVCGMLAIIAVAFVAVIVVGIVQTYRNKQKIKEIIFSNEEIMRNFDNSLEENYNTLNNSINNLHDELDNELKAIYECIEINRTNTSDIIKKLKSEIDSGVDKLQEKINK